MFELLPGVGVLLPDGAGTLRFGTDEVATREALAGLGRVRDPGGLDAGWMCTVQWGDLELTTCAGGGRRDPQAGDLPMAEVVLSRAGPPRRALPGRAPVGRGAPGPGWRGPAAVPVVLDGIDLFGYPAAEVLEALGEDRHPGLRPQAAVPGGYLPGISFRDEPPPESGAPDLARYEDMWTTGRDDWQLERTGSGYLVVRKGDPPMHLLICHDALADQVIANMLAAGVEVVAG
ncbi:hypothetical protein [Streptomyces sp. 1331.2]|uniref:hypothetical protein n=1 Tax=Streptomyces sp. 1331.2 TaxID=1938835 RepID=UPI000BD453D3|nr:hypothetical protein [Streptomyces sp. 1331.2]SOB79628.1 hypothetical protein SAMN06272789_0530 [Streptomyces sp. 1331.2]